MAEYGPYEVHPFADAFPLLEGEEFHELTLDIKRNGLREPVLLTHDKTSLVDGRNRYRACIAAGVDVVHEALGAYYTEPMILDLIVSKNLARRQLNPGQRAAMALEYERFYAEANKAQEADRKTTPPDRRLSNNTPADRRESPRTTGACHCGNDTVGHTHPPKPEPRRDRESATRAAKATGASGRLVQRVKAVQRDAPDLYDKVRRDEIKLDNAYQQARQRVRDQPKPEPVGKPGPVMLTLRTNTGDEVPYPQPQAKAKFNESTGDGISWASWSWNPVTGCLHGCSYCLTPDTPVLMADWTWRPIGDVQVGEQLLGFDEHNPGGKGNERRWRTTEIQASWRTTQTAHRIALDDGRALVASAEHKWLCDRDRWRTTAELQPGHRIRTVFDPATVEHDEDYEAGYIAGATLGDGTFRWDPAWRSDKLGYPQSYWRVAVLAADRAILDRLREYLAHADVEVNVRSFDGGPSARSSHMAKVETRRLANMPIIDKLCRERASDTWWAGWLAGMFDTEGSVTGGSLRISQKDTAVLDSVVTAAGRLGFTFGVETWANSTSTARLVGDQVEQGRFLAALRPALTRKGSVLVGSKVRTGTATVVSIEPSLQVEMVDITTSTRTFVADGLFTHNCYARDLATRDSYKSAYPVGFTPLFHHERLDAPVNTVIPERYRDDPAWRRVFVCSMADLYGRWVPGEWIDQVHASMLASPQWEYLLLTKFPSRYVGLDMPPNAWVGTSVDEQKRVRIAEEAFRKIDGVKVKWLSLEPLREPLEFADLSMFDWVVIGAQTETRQPDGVIPAFAPPFEWVSRIVAQAREAGCKVHLKPNLLGKTHPGSPGMQLPNEYPVAP